MIPIFDGHNDTLRRLFLQRQNQPELFFKECNTGHLDLTRAKKGGLIGGFFSINVPNPNQENLMKKVKFTNDGYRTPLPEQIGYLYAKEFTDNVIEFTYNLEINSQNKVRITKSYSELEECVKKNLFIIILHLEGAEAIDYDLKDLNKYYEKGIRAIAPLWSRKNIFGKGVPFNFGSLQYNESGLTEIGKKLIEKCNRMGILIDTSHMNLSSFWDMVGISKAPVVASHSNVYRLSKSSRNLTDKQIKAIGESNGIIGINFSAGFIRDDGYPNKNTPINTLVNHINHIRNLIGTDHIGIGSDFDGSTLIKSLDNVEKLPIIIKALEKENFNKEEIKKFCYKNWFRVIKNTWKK
ncbi:MAG: peptidase [Candidatus Lokiarchaeota archaeon]|nr:peptidase [Candidatus Lokiarchaeota archaeon]MBD3199881.1 peptidase [Candidatus Lokiarchaeota archaeon]